MALSSHIFKPININVFSSQLSTFFSLFFGNIFHGQADTLTLFIHIQNRDLDHIANLYRLTGMAQALAADLTDMDKAMKVLRDAVIESEYSEPEWKNKDYGPVYFIAYADSSLVLATTVYYKPTNATEMVMSDINKRVNDAFAREGIEIPYNYVNVVMKKDD